MNYSVIQKADYFQTERIKMEKSCVYLFVYFLCFESCGCAMFDEPRCSKYDFEEKVLEKVLRFELKMETMTETLKGYSTQMKDEITQMKGEISQMKMDWTDTKERFQADWEAMQSLAGTCTCNISWRVQILKYLL